MPLSRLESRSSRYPESVPGPPTVTSRALPYPGAPGDVPRNNNGWPTIEPAAFTVEQLLREAARWGRAVYEGDYVGYETVKDAEFARYTAELLRRGFLDEIDLREWRRSGRAPDLVFHASDPKFPELRHWVSEWPHD